MISQDPFWGAALEAPPEVGLLGAHHATAA
jgi:hypothetical protein